MAKHAKRRKKATTHRRRRRIGALSMSASSPLVTYGPIVAGYVFGSKINAALDGIIPATVDGKIVGAGQVGIGYLLALKKGGKKSLVKSIAGGLMLGAGAKRLLTSFGIGGIGGYQMVTAVSGYQAVPAVGYGSSNRRIAGYSTTGNPINGYQITKQAIGSTNRTMEGSGLLN